MTDLGTGAPSVGERGDALQDEPPLLGCDLPLDRPGLTVHNELVLEGWAVSAKGISGVVVQIDDRLLHAAYGLETPWVAESMPAMTGAAHAGYSLRVDTSGWKPGPRRITIAAFDGEGGRGELVGGANVIPYVEPAFTPEDNRAVLAEGGVAMWLEQPRIVEGPAEVEGPVQVTGWAAAADGIEAVVVTIDGVTAYEALRPIVRPDLLEEYGAEIAGEAGFTLRLHPNDCPPGRHHMTVVAIGSDGRAVGIGNDVDCRPAPDPPAGGDAEQIDWLERRTVPRERDDDPLERYDAELHGDLVCAVEHEVRYRWAAALAKSRDVLDAGCGLGWGSLLLAEAGAKRTVGLDVSEQALAAAEQRAVDGSLELVQGDLAEMPFRDASFDLIVCFETIERVADPAAAIEELRRVLRPDGILLISTPRRRPVLRDDPHPGRFTPGEFERALRESFANVRLHRQHTSMSATILDDDALEVGDGETDLGVDVRKLDIGRPGGETYTVAVAGDGDLPDLERIAMLGSPRPVRRLHETAYAWEDRALLAEADAAASRTEANLAQMHQIGAVRALRQAESALSDALSAHRAKLEAKDSELETLRTERDAIQGTHDAAVAERDAARADFDIAVAERDAARADFDIAVAERDAARADLDAAQAEHDATRADSEATLDAAATRFARAQARLAEQKASHDALTAQLAEADGRAQIAERRADALEQSRSWRITRPLRSAKGLGRRVGSAFRRGA